MTDNNVKEISQPTINTPLDTGKKTLKDLLDEKSYELKELSFINDCILFCNDNYLIPPKRKFLIKYNDFIVLLTVNKKKSSVTVKKITNFIIQSVKEIIYHTNPLLGKEEIKKSNNNPIILIEIKILYILFSIVLTFFLEKYTIDTIIVYNKLQHITEIPIIILNLRIIYLLYHFEEEKSLIFFKYNKYII